MTLMMLNGEMNVTPPTSMAVADDGQPVGWAGVATVVPKDYVFLEDFAEHPDRVNGWFNVYVLPPWRKGGADGHSADGVPA